MKSLLPAILATALSTGALSADTVKIKGSDSNLPVIEALVKAFKEANPDGPDVVAEGGGSGSGLKALAKKEAHIATTSRPMRDSEKEAIETATNEKIKTALGAFAAYGVVVHKDNPVEKITMDDIKQIWGVDGKTTKWSQLPKGGDADIVPLSRPEGGGSFGSIWKSLTDDAKLRDGMKELESSSATAKAVAADPNAIGLIQLRKTPEGYRAVPLAKTKEDAGVSPTAENVTNGTYPIARRMLLHTAGRPSGDVKKFMDWLGSDAAKKTLARGGLQSGIVEKK